MDSNHRFYPFNVIIKIYVGNAGDRVFDVEVQGATGTFGEDGSLLVRVRVNWVAHV